MAPRGVYSMSQGGAQGGGVYGTAQGGVYGTAQGGEYMALGRKYMALGGEYMALGGVYGTAQRGVYGTAQGGVYGTAQGAQGVYGVTAPPHAPQGEIGLLNAQIVANYETHDSSPKLRAINLCPLCESYRKVQAYCSTTFPKARIRRIISLHNEALLSRFTRQKEVMMGQTGIEGGLELMLYHGTRSRNIDSICVEGFDCSRCSRSRLGYGTYFAVDGAVSARFTRAAKMEQDIPRVIQLAANQCPRGAHQEPGVSTTHVADLLPIPQGPTAVVSLDRWRTENRVVRVYDSSQQSPSPHAHLPSSPFRRIELSRELWECLYFGTNLHYMLLVRVLVGRWRRGEREYRAPPPLSEDGGGQFADSCVDDEKYPGQFVIFNSHQTYPQFLLEFDRRG